MSDDEQTTAVLTFRKELAGREVFCRVQVFADGSAYAAGDEIEVIFEGSADVARAAAYYLEHAGYTLVKEQERGLAPRTATKDRWCQSISQGPRGSELPTNLIRLRRPD